ncbi:MAG: triple tyrosine motif-containing protein, partial [Bacteroidota bacterium]
AIPTFLVLKNGQVLLAASDGKTAKIILLDPEARRFQTLAKAGESEKLKTAPLFFLENEAGQVWVAGNEGLALFDPGARRFLDFPGDSPTAHEFPMAVLFLEKESLWCGTLGGGLRRLDVKTGAWQVFTMRNGLPANKIAGILPDGNGNLWISTWDGLSFFQPQVSLFTNFFTANSLVHNEFNRFSFFKNSDGTLFFGGLKGVSFFKPGELLTSFSQGSDSLLISQISWFAPDGRTRQEQIFGFDRLQKITLPPGNRFCSIRLALANYLLPEANRFSWKLEGYDDDWHLNGTNNEITFHYLPSGTYRLIVRAANPTGVWGKNERVLQIEVREFWYKTAWFFGLLAAATGGLFYFFYRSRVRRKLDLAESRRIHEIDHLRARLYTNLTHEFRTPLTVILGMAQQIRNSPAQFLEEGTRMIERNGKSLLQLINQLLDLSKLENNALRLQLVQQDIVPYLRYVTEAFQTYANSKNLSLR